MPGDNKISFDLGNVTSTTEARYVAPIYYYATTNAKEDSLKEISYTAKATKTTNEKLSISNEALNTIVNVMNTYSSGPIQTQQLKNSKEQEPSSPVPPSTDPVTALNLSKWDTQNSWIDDDLSIETAKHWSSIDNGAISIPTVDITVNKFGGTKPKPLYKKHNGIIWKIDYDSTLQSIVLKPKNDTDIKLYKASSTIQTTKAVEYKQVYFKETLTPEKSMKVTVVIK